MRETGIRPETRPATRRRSVSYFPPWWSILLTLLLVVVCVGTLVLAVLLPGGNAAPAEPPRLTILTAPPVATFESLAGAIITPTLSGALPATDPPGNIAFVMDGPTLPPPAITPTAINVDLNRTVRVVDVGDDQLNVRERPGVVDVGVAFRAPENTLFTVVDGPTQADGLTWWKVQGVDNPGRSGWAASNYLEVVPDVPTAVP